MIGYAIPMSGLSERELSRRTALIAELLPPKVPVKVLEIPEAPPFLESREAFESAVEAATSFFRTIDPAEFSVLVWAGALDPGLQRLRGACPVPIVGPGESTLYVASLFGRPISVVTIDRASVALAEPFVKSLTHKPEVVSARSIDMSVTAISEQPALAAEALRRQCIAAVEQDRARALYLGAMSLGGLGSTRSIQKELGVPVFDPLPIALAVAVQCSQAAHAQS